MPLFMLVLGISPCRKSDADHSVRDVLDLIDFNRRVMSESAFDVMERQSEQRIGTNNMPDLF
ncbi:hypothetical protein GCM10027018_20000 [Paenibacillus thermoaerophilus]